MISLVTVMEDGDQVEAMTVGNDGFTGIPVFHGVETTKNKVCGQISGTARRLTVKDHRTALRALAAHVTGQGGPRQL